MDAGTQPIKGRRDEHSGREVVSTFPTTDHAPRLLCPGGPSAVDHVHRAAAPEPTARAEGGVADRLAGVPTRFRILLGREVPRQIGVNRAGAFSTAAEPASLRILTRWFFAGPRRSRRGPHLHWRHLPSDGLHGNASPRSADVGSKALTRADHGAEGLLLDVRVAARPGSARTYDARP